MSASIEAIERCVIDSPEGNVANALGIIQGRAQLREPLSDADLDEIEARLVASLGQMRSLRPASLSDLARQKIDQFRVRPLPAFPCPTR